MDNKYVTGYAPTARPRPTPDRLQQYSDMQGLPAPQPPVQLDVGAVEQGPQLDVGPVEMNPTGLDLSVEAILAQALTQRALVTAQEAAAKEASFKHQIAMSQRAKQMGAVTEAEGMRQYQLDKQAPPDHEERALRIATGRGSVREYATTDPSVMAGIMGRAGKAMYHLGEQDYRAEMDRNAATQFRRDGLVYPDQVKAPQEDNPSPLLENAQPGPGMYLRGGDVLGGPPGLSQRDGLSGEQLDQIVQGQGYFPELFSGMGDDEAIGTIAAQLDARRRQQLGDWDPSMMSGPF